MTRRQFGSKSGFLKCSQATTVTFLKGSCVKKVRMFCPRNSTPWAKELPSPTSHSNRSLRTEVSVAGKRNFQRGDKEAETTLEIQRRRCETKSRSADSANSGLIARFREISVRTRVRGGSREDSNLQPSGY